MVIFTFTPLSVIEGDTGGKKSKKLQQSNIDFLPVKGI